MESTKVAGDSHKKALKDAVEIRREGAEAEAAAEKLELEAKVEGDLR